MLRNLFDRIIDLRSLPRVVWMKLPQTFHDFALWLSAIFCGALPGERVNPRGLGPQSPLIGAGHAGPAPSCSVVMTKKADWQLEPCANWMDLRIDQFSRANQSKPRYIAKGLLLALSRCTKHHTVCPVLSVSRAFVTDVCVPALLAARRQLRCNAAPLRATNS